MRCIAAYFRYESHSCVTCGLYYKALLAPLFKGVLYHKNSIQLRRISQNNVFYQNSRLLHNETINIWSHLLGFLILAGIFFRDLIFVLPSTESGIEVTHTDFFILFALILCYQVSLFDLLKIILETVTKTLRSLT